MTGTAFIYSAIFRESSLAPPTWPDKIGITNLPASSITITAGSSSFDFTCLEMARTAIPQAPTKINALAL